MGLDNATEISGAVVTITGDLSALKNSFAQAVSITQQETAKLSKAATVKVTVDTAELRQQMAQAKHFLGGYFGDGPQTMNPAQLRASGYAAAGIADPASAKSVARVQKAADAAADGLEQMARATGGGGRGGAANPLYNPFSNRGLARMVGNGMMVYGAQAATRFAGEVVGAFDIAGNSARILDSMTPAFGSLRPSNDPFMRRMAGSLAGNAGGQQFMSALNGLPIVGGVFNLLDQLSGTSASLRADEARITKDVRLYEILSESQMKGRVTQAQLNRDPLGAFDAETKAHLLPYQNAAAAHPAYTELGAKAAKELDNQRNLRAQGRDQLAAQLKMGIHVLENAADNTRALASAYDVELREGSYSPTARKIRQNAELSEIATRYGAMAAGKPQAESSAIAKAGDAEIAAARARFRLEDERAEADHQAKLTSLTASATATRLRIINESLAAQLTEISAARNIALLHTKDPTERTAVNNAFSAQATGAILGHYQGVAERTSGYMGDTAALNLRAQRRNFEGELAQLDAGAASIGNIQNPMEKAAAVAKYQAQRNLLISERRNAMTMGAFGLTTQSGAADLLIRQEPRAAEMYTQTRDLVAGVMNADPSLQGQARQVALKQLQAMRVGMQYRGGVEAEVTDTYNAIGDPLNAKLNKTDRADAFDAIAQAEKSLKKMGVGRGDNIPDARTDFSGNTPPPWLSAMVQQLIQAIGKISASWS